MLRRLATLSVLLLSLSGVIPTALACAPGVQATCCPVGSSTPRVYNEGPCCVAEVGSDSIAAAILEAEPRVTDIPSPDQPNILPTSAAAPSEIAATRTTASNIVSHPDLHQQQIYLLTGRLRL